MSNLDIEQIITDSVNEATFDSAPISEPAEPTTEEAAPVAETSTQDTPSEALEAPTSDAEPSSEVQSPASRNVAPTASKDDFERLAGMPAVGVAGRENRIPYSRVKKITEKAVFEKVGELAEAALGRKLGQGEKALDVVKSHVAQIPALAAKVTDYESRLKAVSEFEQVMTSDPQKFLGVLATVPAYKDFFEFVEKAYQAQAAAPQQPVAASNATVPGNAPAAPGTTVNADDPMPEPDEALPDGSKVYSMGGLTKLLDWKAKQVEGRVASQFSKQLDDYKKSVENRYGQIEQDWKERQRVAATLPLVQAQIAEARTWHLFNENEDAIIAKLNSDPKISLQGAYYQIVMPKLIAERNTMKQSLLAEIKNAPAATAVPNRAPTKPNPPATGQQSIEQIIRDSMESLRR